MKRGWRTVAAWLLCVFLGNASATAAIIVGVNTVNPQWLNDQQQDAEIEALGRDGVTTIRLPLIDERSTRFITRAYARGIGAVVIISPVKGSAGAPLRTADPALGLTWPQAAFSGIDPRGFRGWFTPMLGTIEAAGVRLTALEFGNEINSAPYDGDFSAEGTGRVLGLQDLATPAIRSPLRSRAATKTI